MPELSFHTIVIGAGASGLMCAATAAAKGHRVLLVDHATSPGRKLCITGGGKGNVTNLTMGQEHFFGENPPFCRSALARFTPEHMLHWLKEAGIAVEEREQGQIFCRSSAEKVRDMLVQACSSCVWCLGANKILLKHSLGQTPAFSLQTPQGIFCSNTLVIATGSPAWPQVGATNLGFTLAKGFGHRVVPPRPALVGLTLPLGHPLLGLAGIALPVNLYLPPAHQQGSKSHPTLPSKGLVANCLSMLFTHTGISGPAALQASLYWEYKQELECDFLPQSPIFALLEEQGSGKLLLKNLLKKHLPTRLVAALLPQNMGDKKSAELTKAERVQLATTLHSYRFTPTGTEGYRKAEVAAGGVSTENVGSKTMQSTLVPGLYFCGEVLDITGRLGGYNLHWAFASGYAAGLSV